MNLVILEGRLGRDPDVRATQGGDTVARLRVATNSYYKGEEKTEWHSVVAFGKAAEFAEKYLTKGREVLVEGRLQTRNYEKGGETKWTTEVVARSLQAVGPKPGNGNGNGNYGGSNQPDNDDDLPF